jgi:hypothetical protein
MSNPNIISVTQRDDSPVSWPWVYFHGKLEDHVGANKRTDDYVLDLVSSDQPKPTKAGVYHVEVYGKPCVAYIWNPDKGFKDSTGLIVDPTDTDSVEDAIKKCKARQVTI